MIDINYVSYSCPDCGQFLMTDNLPQVDYNSESTLNTEMYCSRCKTFYMFKYLSINGGPLLI